MLIALNHHKSETGNAVFQVISDSVLDLINDLPEWVRQKESDTKTRARAYRYAPIAEIAGPALCHTILVEFEKLGEMNG